LIDQGQRQQEALALSAGYFVIELVEKFSESAQLDELINSGGLAEKALKGIQRFANC
jgi:hypothetical protein